MIHVNFLHRALDLLTKSDRNKDCIYLQDDIPESMEALPGMSFQGDCSIPATRLDDGGRRFEPSARHAARQGAALGGDPRIEMRRR